MRASLLALFGATLIIDAAAMADANAAIRRSQSGTQSAPTPIVNQNDPYFSYGVNGRRDVHPASGTPRWNGGGGPG